MALQTYLIGSNDPATDRQVQLETGLELFEVGTELFELVALQVDDRAEVLE